jgi:hypothetical protein
LRNGLRTPCCFATIDPLSLAVPSPVTMLVRHAYSCRWSRHRSAGPLLARFPAPAAPESAGSGQDEQEPSFRALYPPRAPRKRPLNKGRSVRIAR